MTHDVTAIVTPEVTRAGPQKIKIKIIQIKDTAGAVRFVFGSSSDWFAGPF